MVRTSLEKFAEVAEQAKSNEIYDIHDLKMEHLVISTTRLHAGKETRGHEHAEKEEVYLCLEGSGKLIMGEETAGFAKGDLVTIPAGDFHKVVNDSEADLVFLCVFEKYERE
jgi:quercetin dioxygenase-like cupin family protein|tara:strand:+ start:3184 stop:3519 length:336 start_codon:yes stop_codon:yes gene_type:complete